MKSRIGWKTHSLLLLACLGSFSSKAHAVDPWDTAAASSELTALYAWTTATGPTTRSIEVQLFGTVFPGAISQPTLLLDSGSASALCPSIEFIPERKAFAVVYSRYEPSGTSSANVSLRVALVSALTGRVITSGTILERSVTNVDADFRPQASAFCPRTAYLTESRRLLVVWVVQNMALVSEDPLAWDALDKTGEDAFWGLHFDPLQRDFQCPRPLRLGPSVTFTRQTSDINTLDVAYAPRSATGWKTGNVLVTCAGRGPGQFPEQANFFTFRANTLSGAAPSQVGWPDAVLRGFCGTNMPEDNGPGCLPSSIYASVAFQSGLGFGPPRFAIATTDRLGRNDGMPTDGGFATLFFVAPTCDATACPLETPGRVALAGDDAVMFGVSAAEAPCRVPAKVPGTTRASSCVYVAFRFTTAEGSSVPSQWGLVAYDYGTFAAITPGPRDFLRLGELPGLERQTLGPSVIGLTHLTRSTLPFAPAVAVIFSVIRVRDGVPLDEFPLPYLVRFDTAGRQISPAGEAGFIE